MLQVKSTNIFPIGHRKHTIDPVEALAQTLKVLSGQGPQASILKVRILQGKPETEGAQGFGIEKTAVLVPDHFAADVGLLENHHRLQQQGIVQAKLASQHRETGLVGENLKV